MFVFFCDRLIPLSIMATDFIHAVTYVRSSFILILSNSPFYVFGCLWSMGQQWPATGAGALGAVELGMAEALLEEVTLNPP